MPRPSSTSSAQRGMAIISALLIAAVVAVIAGGMLTRQGIFTRALEAEQSRVQGSVALLGHLETSRQLLWDALQDGALTRLDQAWARPIGSLAAAPSNRGLQARLDDQQGKFNLRNLMANERVDIGQLRSFERLCAMIGINAMLSQRISQRVIASYPQVLNQAAGQARTAGGFDSGRATSPNASLKPLPATQPMLRSLDDLRGIEGLDEPALIRLRQYVSILPGNTWVNSNTASAEVLAAVVPGLTLPRARALVAERDHGQWFINRGDFVNRARLPGLAVDGLTVGIGSEWFLFQGESRLDRRRVSLQALLHRPQDRMPRVIWSREGV